MHVDHAGSCSCGGGLALFRTKTPQTVVWVLADPGLQLEAQQGSRSRLVVLVALLLCASSHMPTSIRTARSRARRQAALRQAARTFSISALDLASDMEWSSLTATSTPSQRASHTLPNWPLPSSLTCRRWRTISSKLVLIIPLHRSVSQTCPTTSPESLASPS